jgi:hypothetical protein
MANKRASIVRAVFRGIARTQSTFTIEIGPIRASGVPAVLLAVSGVIVASGIAGLISRGRLPETLREARGLADSLRGERHRLYP